MPLDVLFLGGTSVDLIQEKGADKNRSRFLASVGGSTTNSAVIAAKIGLKTAMVSRIGKDALGDFAIHFLASCRVNTKGIIRDPSIRTPIAIANIAPSGNSGYTFYKNTSKDAIVCFKDAPKDLLRHTKILHFGSSFSYQKDTSQEALRYVKFLKKRHVFISFDPNIRPYTIKDKIAARDRVLRLVKLVDLLKISEVDLEFLTGRKDPEKGLRKLKKLSRCEIILTLGSKGSAYLKEPLRPKSLSLRANFTLSLRAKRSSLNLIKVPAFKVKTADTIGAGDAYTAGLLYKIAKAGKRRVFDNIRPAMVFASALSAIICTKPGANQGLKDIKQVNSFLAEYVTLRTAKCLQGVFY